VGIYREEEKERAYVRSRSELERCQVQEEDHANIKKESKGGMWAPSVEKFDPQELTMPGGGPVIEMPKGKFS